MKETKIAKENVNGYKYSKEKEIMINRCEEHKQNCKRWLKKDKKELEILEDLTFFNQDRKNVAKLLTNKRNNIKDKKQAIKIYDEAGI